MKTTIDIPDQELKDAMRCSKARSKRDAVVDALVEYNRRRRIPKLPITDAAWQRAYDLADRCLRAGKTALT